MTRFVNYLVEAEVNGSLQPISIQCDYPSAMRLAEDKKGIVTEMELDEVYPEGLAVCEHWHFGEDKNETNEV